ncbi:MAG: hypothetical protein ACTSRD_09480 [Promethearchaeota archaeon]
MTGAFMVRFRDPKNPLNRSFYNFFLYFSLGFVINIIYRLLPSEFWKAFLGRITIGVITFAFIFLLQFNLILLDENSFNKKKRWITTLSWLVICSGFVYLDWNNGARWVVNSNFPSGIPYWSTSFTLYALILSQGLFIVIFIISNITQQRIDPNKPKAKHFRKNLVIFFFNWFLVGNIVNNWELIRENASWFSIFMFYSTFLALPGIILFWLSAIKKVE